MRAAGILVVLLVCGPVGGARAATRTTTLSAPAAGIGLYEYFPVAVDAGTDHLDVEVSATSSQAKFGAGIYDPRGAGFGAPGFRGVYGEEIHTFTVGATSASRGFVAGPMPAGTWTVVVPLFTVPEPTTITVKVTQVAGPGGDAPALEPAPELVDLASGWYAGDLHDHSTYSSDAFASKTALDPAGLAARGKQLGLQWLSLTDHNITAQNDRLRSESPPGFLLLGGEEVTNWFHGHATATGMAPGAFYDWRWRPLGLPIDPAHEGRVRQVLDRARADGVYTAAAHPLGAALAWQSFSDSDADPLALPDGLEVWNGPFQADDEGTLKEWDRELLRGRHVCGNGGSDVHGLADPATEVGFPTTVVWATQLSRAAVVAALKACRGYVTTAADGPALYMTGTAPGGQRQTEGGTLYGGGASASVLVRRGAGTTLHEIVDGAETRTVPITSDEQRVPLTTSGSYVRVELRRGDAPAALSNPMFFAAGPVPPGTTPVDAPPPPRAAGAAGASCAAGRTLRAVRVRPVGRGLRIAVRRRAATTRYDVDVIAVSPRGRRVVLRRRGRASSAPLRFDGATAAPAVVVRVRSGTDVRRVVAVRRGARYVLRPTSVLRRPCTPVPVAALARPVADARPIRLTVRLASTASVAVSIDGRSTGARRTVRGGLTRRRLATATLRRGLHRVTVQATDASGATTTRRVAFTRV